MGPISPLTPQRTGSLVRDSWRPYAMYGTQARLARLVRRLTLTAITLLLLLWLLYLLLRPFVHPNTYFVFLEASDINPLVIDPQAFAMEDYAHLMPLETALKRPPEQDTALPMVPLTDPEQVAQQLQQLEQWQIGRGEALIVYVKSHALVLDGAPVLLCDNYYPRLETEGLFPLANLLEQLRGLRAGTKLLVLDTGQLSYDRRLGSLANDFPRAVKAAVEELNDPNLWVLLSHSNLQQAETSRALQRSAFGFMFARGMKGAADLNADQQISLQELSTYLRCGVDQWTRQYTGGASGQLPLLLRGNGIAADSSASPLLLSIASIPQQQREADVSAAMATAQSPTEQSTISKSVQSHLTYYAQEQQRRTQQKFRPGHRTQEILGKVGGSTAQQIPSGATDETDQSEDPAAESAESQATADDATPDDSAPPVADAQLDADSVELNLQYQATVTQLLAELWTFRDQLLASDRSPRILDYAPDLWRQFEWQLLQAEQEHASGVAANQIALAEKLRDLSASIQGLLAGEPPRRRRTPNLIDQARRRHPLYHTRGETIYSLALAEMLQQYGYTLNDQEQAALGSFREALAQPDRQAFDRWLTTPLPPSMGNYNELRLARQLGEQYGLSWQLIQLALETQLLGEQIATQPQADASWFREQLAAVDMQRAGAQRKLLTRIGSDWQQQAQGELRLAKQRYEALGTSIKKLQQLIRLRNELLLRAPYYVHWHAVSPPGQLSPSTTDLSALLTSLAELCQLLQARPADSLPRIMLLGEQLRQQQARLDSVLDNSEEIIRELGSNPAPGDAQRLAALLATPLLPQRLRQLAAENQLVAEGQLMSGFEVSLELLMLEQAHRLDEQQLKRFLQQAQLELQLARLTLLEQDKHAASLDQLSEQLSELQQQLARHRPLSEAAFWPLLRRTTEGTAAVYADLPNRLKRSRQATADLSSWEDRPAKVARLRNANQAHRLLDPRDATRIDSAALGQQLGEVAWFDHMAWQHDRSLLQLADAPLAQRSYLAAAAESYRRIASDIPRQPALSDAMPPGVELSGPDYVSLASTTETQAVIQIRKRPAANNRVWLLIEYDPSLIEVSHSATRVIYRVDDLQSQLSSRAGEMATQLRMLALTGSPTDRSAQATSQASQAERAARYPIRPDLSGLPESLVLAPGESSELLLNIKRLATTANDTRLIVKAINADTYVRHEMVVRLPGRETIQLLAADTRNDWVPTLDGLLLHPLPNRSSSYALYLKNHGDRQRTVDLQWLVPQQRIPAALPVGEQSAEVAQQLMQRMGPLTPWQQVTGIQLPTGGQPLPLATPVQPSNNEPRAAEADPPAKPGAEEKSAEQNKPPPVVLDHGLLAVITDQQTGHVMLRHVSLAPQRPRRFVQAEVGYNSTTQQVEVRVTPLNRFAVPPAGIRVEATFAEALPPGAESRLSGVIKAPNYEARLFADLPPAHRREVTLQIHVDDYPRAFSYRVPIGPQANNLPELADRFQVVIESPDAGAAYRSPLETVGVEVRVDAPRGSFPPDYSDDYVEIGLDVDRDREFRDEKTYRFHSDRLVVLTATDFTPGGVLQLETRVSDFQLQLPTDGLSNTIANLLARAGVGPHVRWSESVPILLDATAPAVDRLEMNPGRRVEVEQELEVSVWSSDANLSGATKVEIGLGSPNGTFAEKPAAVEASLISGVRWSGKLKLEKLEPGLHTVLIRLTDAVGNVSRMHKESIQIIPAGSLPPENAPLAGATISGVVKYGEQLFPKATVSLLPTDENVEPIEPLETDDQGRFSFKKVAPGDYTLTAQGLMRNKLRKAEVEVTIEADDNGLHLFTLQPR